jgi:hypothetical protein
MSETGTAKYGNYYWCIKTKLSEDGEIFVMADEARVLGDGSLSMVRKVEGKPESINLAIAAGHWSACYAASVLDGSAVAVERWKGEVER